MRKTLASFLALAILIGFTSVTFAGYPKKHEPSKRDVEKALEAIGGEHFPAKMKIKDVGYIKTGTEDPPETSYFWVFSGKLDDDSGYHLIIFDNTPTYLGYYQVTAEPADTDGQQNINLYVEGNIDPTTGAPLPTPVALDDSGPAKRIQIGGVPSPFVPAPAPEETATNESTSHSMAPSTSSSFDKPAKAKPKPEYRSWHIAIGDKVIQVDSAIFVEYKDGNVTIKDAKTGRTVTRPAKDFSDEDKEYIKELLK